MFYVIFYEFQYSYHNFNNSYNLLLVTNITIYSIFEIIFYLYDLQ
jgi:hypothetical protein